MKALTWDDWKDAGYYIRKGEKATGRNKQGKPTWTRDQVEPATERTNGESTCQ